MANNKNDDVCAGASVDQRVRETPEREAAAVAIRWCAESGVGDQLNRHALKFRQECARQTDAALLPIKLKGVLQLRGCFGVEGIRH